MNLPSSRNLATALINVGSLYSELGDKVKAIQCFERSLKVAEEELELTLREYALLSCAISTFGLAFLPVLLHLFGSNWNPGPNRNNATLSSTALSQR